MGKNKENQNDDQNKFDENKEGTEPTGTGENASSANLPADAANNPAADAQAFNAVDAGVGLETGPHNIPGVMSGAESPTNIANPEGYTGDQAGSPGVAIMKGGSPILDARERSWQNSDNYIDSSLPIGVSVAQNAQVAAKQNAAGIVSKYGEETKHIDNATQAAIVQTAFASLNVAQLQNLGCTVYAVELVRNYRDEDGNAKQDYLRVQNSKENGQPELKCERDYHPLHGYSDENPPEDEVDMNIGPNR